MTTNNSYLVRDAVTEDQERIREIYNEAVLTTVATFDTEERTSEEQKLWWDEHIEEAGRYPVIVALNKKGRCAGWGALSRFSPKPGYRVTGEISIYVAHGHRRSGVGFMIGSELIGRARTRGMLHTIVGRIAAPNSPSLSLARRLGMEHVGTLRRVGCKFDRIIDVELFQLVL